MTPPPPFRCFLKVIRFGSVTSPLVLGLQQMLVILIIWIVHFGKKKNALRKTDHKGGDKERKTVVRQVWTNLCTKKHTCLKNHHIPIDLKRPQKWPYFGPKSWIPVCETAIKDQTASSKNVRVPPSWLHGSFQVASQSPSSSGDQKEYFNLTSHLSDHERIKWNVTSM